MELYMKKLLLGILVSTQLATPAITKDDLSHLWGTAKEMFSQKYLNKHVDHFIRKVDTTNDRIYSRKLIVFASASALTGAAVALLIRKYFEQKPYNIFIITFEDDKKVIHHYEANPRNNLINQLIKDLVKENTTILKRSSKNIFLEIKEPSEKTGKLIKQIAEHSKDVLVLRG